MGHLNTKEWYGWWSGRLSGPAGNADTKGGKKVSGMLVQEDVNDSPVVAGISTRGPTLTDNARPSRQLKCLVEPQWKPRHVGDGGHFCGGAVVRVLRTGLF